MFQALLQITKNLFTHLGKCITGLVTYPDLITECSLLAKDAQPLDKLVDNFAKLSEASLRPVADVDYTDWSGCEGLSLACMSKYSSCAPCTSSGGVSAEMDQETESVSTQECKRKVVSETDLTQPKKTKWSYADSSEEIALKCLTPSVEALLRDMEAKCSPERAGVLTRNMAAKLRDTPPSGAIYDKTNVGESSSSSCLPGSSVYSVESEILNTAFIHISSEDMVADTETVSAPNSHCKENDESQSQTSPEPADPTTSSDHDVEAMPGTSHSTETPSFFTMPDLSKVGAGMPTQAPISIPKCPVLGKNS